jgi:hypothetical protein
LKSPSSQGAGRVGEKSDTRFAPTRAHRLGLMEDFQNALEVCGLHDIGFRVLSIHGITIGGNGFFTRAIGQNCCESEMV